MDALGRSWMWFRRGCRRELRLPFVGLVLAAAAAGGVAAFSAQLARTVTTEADGALGADLVVSAPAPLPSSLKALAERLDLRSTTEVALATVAVAGERLRLASVRAVTAPYPLRGEMRLRRRSGAPEHPAAGIPRRGNVWIGPALAAALARGPGDTITLGRSTLRVGALLTRAPGSELDLAGIAPVVVMNAADLPATGLAGPQGRVEYQLLLAGPAAAIVRFRSLARPLLPETARLQDVNDVAPEVRAPLDGTRNFLRLAVLATLLIAAAALIQSVRHYAAIERKNAAVLKTLGATRGAVRRLYGIELLWLTSAAAALGTLAALAVALGLAALGTHWFGLAFAPLAPATLIVAPVTAAILAAGLWLPPILTLADARPAAILRGSFANGRLILGETIVAAAALILLMAICGFSAIAVTLWTLAAAAALAAILALLGYLLLAAIAALRTGFRPGWRYGTAMLARRRSASLAELIAFGLVLTVILLLVGVRHDLVSNWRASLPANAPDHFVVNIQPEQRAGVRSFLGARAPTAPKLYPMVRARLVAIDGVPVARWRNRITGARARGLLLREQTLSTRSRPGAGNTVVAGTWWTANGAGKPVVSVDSGWARSIGVGLGDRLKFAVADRVLTLRIASLRRIKWQSFEPNFFLVTPPGTLDGYPATWITAVHLGANEQDVVELLRRFPNLTVVNVNTILGAVTDLLQRAAEALAFTFALALAAAVLVLAAALQASRAQREREMGLLRVFGARRRQLTAALAAEFGLLGAIAGCAAGLVAAGAGYALARWVFDLPPAFDGWLVLAGALGGSLGVGGIGVAATLHLARRPPCAALRRPAT